MKATLDTPTNKGAMTTVFLRQGNDPIFCLHFKKKEKRNALYELSACFSHNDSQEDKNRSSFVIHADLLCYQMNAFSGAGASIVASQQEGQGLILPFLCGVFALSPHVCVLVLQVLWPSIAIKKTCTIN